MAALDLIFATGNNHKSKEVSQILNQDWLDIKSLKDIDWVGDIAETGDTLSDNALIKARTVYNKVGGNVFSEDTGLEVFSLGMAPGVHTARYAGPSRDAQLNMSKLISELVDGKNRTARFRTVVALIWEGEEHLFEGLVNGRIAFEIKGSKGFGYDPVFMPYGYDKTFAEMDDTEKNAISHRFRAMMGLKKFLATQKEKRGNPS